ncbi:MAG: LysR family transcriptional regulator [Gammaproteobacteria bacterium]|nr:LysR family transcriptional regulator [Gammaproteobacteria bacterium]
MEWQGVVEFVAVAESKSFTAAASKLNTSVAQVSRRVAQLEQRLAVKLLNRTTRTVTLTEAGALYYQKSRIAVEGLEEAELAINQMQSTPSGLIKVTAPVTYGERFLAPLLNQFIEQYPQVKLDFILTNQKLDLIESGIDLAIRLGRLESSGLIAKRLTDRQLYVCASPSYLAHHGEPHSLSELSQHQCLVGSINHWRFMQDKQEKSVRISGRLKCNSGQALLDAALRDLGLVQLPEYYVKNAIELGKLQEVLKSFRDKKEGIWAVYPENRNLSSKLRLLIDFLAEKLPRL